MSSEDLEMTAASLLSTWTDSDTAMQIVGQSLGLLGPDLLDPADVLSYETPLRNALFDVLLSLVEGGALDLRPTEDAGYAFRWRADWAAAALTPGSSSTVDVDAPSPYLAELIQVRRERDDALGRADFAEALAAERERLLRLGDTPSRVKRPNRRPAPAAVQTAPVIEVPDTPARPAEPIAVEPVAVEPVVVEPVAVEPVAVEPVAVEPAAVEPVVVEPVVVEPVVVEPVAVEPVAVEPVVVEPVVVDVEPAPVVPAPRKAAVKPAPRKRAEPKQAEPKQAAPKKPRKRVAPKKSVAVEAEPAPAAAEAVGAVELPTVDLTEENASEVVYLPAPAPAVESTDVVDDDDDDVLDLDSDDGSGRRAKWSGYTLDKPRSHLSSVERIADEG